MSKRKVKIKGEAPTVEVEVKLPLYRKHRMDDDDYKHTIYMRVTEGDGAFMREISVGLTTREDWHALAGTDSWELEIDERYCFDERSQEDYTLGKGEHACSKKEFDNALAALIAAAQGGVTR